MLHTCEILSGQMSPAKRFHLLLPFALLLSPRPLRSSGKGLDEFFERFSTEWVRASPWLATTTQFLPRAEQDRLDRLLPAQTAARVKADTALARKGLAELRKLDWKQGTPTQRTSARMMQWNFEDTVQWAPHTFTGYVFNQFWGIPNSLVDFLTNSHIIRNARDADNYVARLHAAGPYLEECIRDARARARRGIVPPKFIVADTIAQIARLTEIDPGQNILVTSLAERMDKITTIGTEQKAALRESARKAVAEIVNPVLRKGAATLEEQLKTATDDAGFWKLPDGAAAYASFLRSATSTNYTPDQVHTIGLEQVARLEKRMDSVLRQLGYQDGTVNERYRRAMQETGYAASPDVRTQILADYDKIIRDAEQRAGEFFDLRPKAKVVVQRVPEFRERNTGGAYYVPPAQDGTTTGIFFVPLPGPAFGRLDMRSRSYHEAVPGHHFQFALEQEATSLPRFRRARVFGFVPAYAEGWGLYVEALALESGWYDDDLPGLLGALERQLFRARRLVVDTGIHAKKWTRQQAIEYGISQAEVDRYIVMPGQACSYMIGQLKILELRDKARRELGERFSIKEFHNVVLQTGSVPLEVLADVVGDYIAAKGR